MKKVIFKLVIFLAIISFLAVSFLTKKPSESNIGSIQQRYPVNDTQFQIGAFDNGWYCHYNYLIDSLKFNVWHNYSAIENGWYDSASDNYHQPIPGFVSQIVDNNNTQNMRTFMDRPIIQYVIGGQRCDYQCESIPNGEPYWFWSFANSLNNGNNIKDTIDNSIYGMGEKVKYCRNINGSGCWIDSALISNRDLSFIGCNSWIRDDYWGWYIMPRLRIDSAYAAGTAHNTDTVCRIIIRGWNGNIVKDIGILIENFKEFPLTSIYHGNYIDTFYFAPGQENLFMNKSLISNFIRPVASNRLYSLDSPPVRPFLRPSQRF